MVNNNNNNGNQTQGGPPSGTIPKAMTLPQSGFRAEVQKLFDAIGAKFPNGTDLLVSGTPMPKQQIEDALNALLGLYADVDTAAGALKIKRLDLKAALPDTHTLVVGIKAGLVALYGRGNPALEDYGISVKKARPLTPEQKVARKAKAKATRELRGTKGSRQKQGVQFVGKVNLTTETVGVPEGLAPTAPADGTPTSK